MQYRKSCFRQDVSFLNIENVKFITILGVEDFPKIVLNHRSNGGNKETSKTAITIYIWRGCERWKLGENSFTHAFFTSQVGDRCDSIAVPRAGWRRKANFTAVETYAKVIRIIANGVIDWISPVTLTPKETKWLTICRLNERNFDYIALTV